MARLLVSLQVVCRCRYQQQTFLSSLSLFARRQNKGKATESLLLRAPVTCLPPLTHRRTIAFTRVPRKFKPRYKEDGVGSDYMVIYENNMNGYHFWGQLCINLLALPVYGMSIRMIVSNWHLQDFSTTSGLLLGSLYIIFYTFLVLGGNSLSRRSITRMYANQDATKFAAVVRDWKLTRKTFFFNLGESRRIPPSNVLGHFFGNIAIKGRHYLVGPLDFVVPKFYNLLLGYDLQRSVDHDIIRDIDIKDILEQSKRKPTEVSKR